MFERLDQIEARYEELTQALASPEIIGDSAKYQKAAKAHSEIAKIVEKYRELKDLKKGIAESKAMLADEKDPEMRAYAQEELHKLEPRVGAIEEELKVLLLPKDPNDEKNVILEIRAGTGGDEATLFAAEMFRMYDRYAESQRWKVEVLSTSESGVGGLKEIIALIEGKGVYSRLKYESGVHRVQRVPATEQQGRIRLCASLIFLPTRSSVARMRSRRSRTARKACGCCARGCMRSRCRSSRRRWQKNGSLWWAAATAARRFALTTSHRTASPIIALDSPFISCPKLWMANSSPSLMRLLLTSRQNG